jgi:transcriptional regulator GlxA family with amidase domain
MSLSGAFITGNGETTTPTKTGLARSIPSLSPMSNHSAHVQQLVVQAMAYLESNRDVARRCLRDAATLLGEERRAISAAEAPRIHPILRPGGLAGWQAHRALEYIESNLGSKMTIRDMADSVGLSVSHFSRGFRRSLGSPPMTYVTARRVEHAKAMMASTRLRLADIALASGFTDQSHLTRFFRRLVGSSPARWRRALIHTG